MVDKGPGVERNPVVFVMAEAERGDSGRGSCCVRGGRVGCRGRGGCSGRRRREVRTHVQELSHRRQRMAGRERAGGGVVPVRPDQEVVTVGVEDLVE